MNLHPTIRIWQGESGLCIGEIPGAVSQGYTPEEARSMVLEAAEILMEERARAYRPHPGERVETLALSA